MAAMCTSFQTSILFRWKIILLQIYWSRNGEWVYTLSTREGKNEIVRFSREQNAASPEVVALLMHAEQDLRCPMEHAEQFFAHMKRQGSEVELLRMPDSSHGLLQIGKVVKCKCRR